MLDTKARKYIQPSMNRIGKHMMRWKLGPMQLTIGAFTIGCLAALMAAFEQSLLACFLLWGSGLLDVLDGTVARLSEKATKTGAYMDLILDRMVEAAMILGFYYAHPEHSLAYLLFLTAVIFNFTTFILAGTLFENAGEKSMYYDFGLAERTETFIVFTVMLFMSSHISLILNAFNVLIFITGFYRFYKVVRYMEDKH